MRYDIVTELTDQMIKEEEKKLHAEIVIDNKTIALQLCQREVDKMWIVKASFSHYTTGKAYENYFGAHDYWNYLLAKYRDYLV